MLTNGALLDVAINILFHALPSKVLFEYIICGLGSKVTPKALEWQATISFVCNVEWCPIQTFPLYLVKPFSRLLGLEMLVLVGLLHRCSAPLEPKLVVETDWMASKCATLESASAAMLSLPFL